MVRGGKPEKAASVTRTTLMITGPVRRTLGSEICCIRYFLYHTCPLHTTSGCGKRKAHINWSMVKPEKAAPITRSTLEDYWPCAGGLSAVNTIGTQLRDLISGLIRWRLTVYGRRRGKREESREKAAALAWVWRMSRLTRDGPAESDSRAQFLRGERGQGDIHFPCSADHEQDWRPYPVDPYSAICDDHMTGSINNTLRLVIYIYIQTRKARKAQNVEGFRRGK